MEQAGQPEALNGLQSEILVMIAFGKSISEICDRICSRMDGLAPGSTSSVLSVSSRAQLSVLAGPGLDPKFRSFLHGFAVREDSTAFGATVYLRESVIISDVAADPVWEDFSGRALSAGYRACYTSPVKARDGTVLGVIAMYFSARRGPTPFEVQVVEVAVRLCAIVIEHGELLRRNQLLATLDTLTGLPNRASFHDRLRTLSAAKDKSFAVMMVDLDHMKRVNDKMGHAAGDALLRTVGHRLRKSGTGTAFRLGGDEFAVVLEDCDSELAMIAAARDITERINIPFPFAGHSIRPDVTIGGALSTSGDDIDTLCQNADFALYHAKDHNRGGFVPFRSSMRRAVTQYLELIQELNEALDDDRILAFYQPIVRLDTAEIIGLEALVRMKTLDGRIATAGEFHHALSDPRIAYRITGRMLDHVARDLRSWIDMGLTFQHVGFNVAGPDFQKADLEHRVTDAFAGAGVPLKHIILEVNESVFMGSGDNRVASEVATLRGMGMKVALDDFGTGFASLTHLLHFPVDIIKIDKSFVDRIVDDKSSAVIVGALIDVARKLDMRIVAEGIETEAQGKMLLELGCVLGQGYRYSPPAPASIITELLKRFGQRPGERAIHQAELPYQAQARSH